MIFKDSVLKEFAARSPELFWLLGEKGIEDFTGVDRPRAPAGSKAFPNAGGYIMRDEGLYLHLNAGDIGAKGRGSHGHNDALAIEVSAYGQPFIVDPGSYVYNLDRDGRHSFRSTAFHSTVMVDGIEQNTTNLETPFIMGNEASPKILSWETSADRDRVEGLHNGYKRLADPVIHHRTVEFDKAGHRLELTDKFVCKLEHEFSFRLHFAPGIELEPFEEGGLRASHDEGGELIVLPNDHMIAPVFEHGFVSRSYGDKRPSTIACWTFTSIARHYRWDIISGKTMG